MIANFLQDGQLVKVDRKGHKSVDQRLMSMLRFLSDKVVRNMTHDNLKVGAAFSTNSPIAS